MAGHSESFFPTANYRFVSFYKKQVIFNSSQKYLEFSHGNLQVFT